MKVAWGKEKECHDKKRQSEDYPLNNPTTCFCKRSIGGSELNPGGERGESNVTGGLVWFGQRGGGEGGIVTGAGVSAKDLGHLSGLGEKKKEFWSLAGK